MKAKLTLYKSLILESVKVDTYLKSVIDRSSDDKATQLAYHEAAGDEETHQRKLLRGIDISLAQLKEEIANFLCYANVSSGNNVYSEIDNSNNDIIYLYLVLDNRFNTSMLEPLAKMCSKYIEDNTIRLWYSALGIGNQIELYNAACVADLLDIKSAFTKKAPVAVHIPYTAKINVSPGSVISVPRGESVTVTYTIDEGAVDDIEAEYAAYRCNGRPQHLCIKVTRGQGCNFFIEGIYPGAAEIALYSAHDEDVRTTIKVTVVE